MTKKLSLHRILLTTVLGVLVVSAAALADHPQSGHEKLRSDMRKLWVDHVVWTRLFLVETTANLPSKDATTQRLLQNQTDIGNAIKPFYGEAAGTKLTGLLREHILIAADLVKAAAAGDNARKEDANKRWVANADEIATFLSTANPKGWPLADTKKMMRDHLNTTTEEVVAHLSKDWKADIAAYDRVREQILHMADTLSAGIVAQYPEKFAG